MSKRSHDVTPKSVRLPTKVRNHYDSLGTIPSKSAKFETYNEPLQTSANAKCIERTKPETPVSRLLQNEQAIMNLSVEKKNKTKPLVIDSKSRKIAKLTELIESIDIEIEVQHNFNDDLRTELEDYRELMDLTKNALDRTIRTKVSKITIDVESTCIEITSLKQSEELFSKLKKKNAPNHVVNDNLVLVEQKYKRLRSIHDDMRSQCQNWLSQAQSVLNQLDNRIALRSLI